MEVKNIYGIINKDYNFECIKKKFKNKIIVATNLKKYINKAYTYYKNNTEKYGKLKLKKDLNKFSNIEKLQLVSIYLALNNNKNILFFIGYMDLNDEKQFIKLIQKLKREYSVNVLIVTNNVDFLIENCEYIYIIENNNIIKSGNRIEVLYDSSFLIEHKIKIPEIVQFYNAATSLKSVKLKQRFSINDLIKDIYREL